MIDYSLIRQQSSRAISKVEEENYFKVAFCLKCGSFDSTRTNSPLRNICDHNGLHSKEDGPIVYKVRNGVDQIRPIKILLDSKQKGGES